MTDKQLVTSAIAPLSDRISGSEYNCKDNGQLCTNKLQITDKKGEAYHLNISHF